MIDEKKLLEVLEKWDNYWGKKSDGFSMLKWTTIIRLKSLVAHQSRIGEWIPCSKPPKDDREVLIFNGKSYSVGYYNGKTWVNAIRPVEWQEINHET